ncbi:MAG: M28 family peptidase [Chitinivibrionales bacterium]|nr:M28 family peptidase [Chitinivibrionales bacterium]MBD3358143.1 M28 family peptidase [Chitinivibrionales bacterium]
MMDNTPELLSKGKAYLKALCDDIEERCVGSEGNRMATRFFLDELISYGWRTEIAEFSAMDWNDGGATLSTNGERFEVFVSPYSLGCTVEAELVDATSIPELEKMECAGKILFLHGEIAAEQLMPKNFVFYNPEEHRKIIGLLEEKKPQAIVCATSRNAALAGGVYPFPLIEDGDFDIPSVYMTEEEGGRLLHNVNKSVFLESKSERVFGTGYNIIGKNGVAGAERIVVTAHIDAKKGSPGAIDDATGIVVLLLLAQVLKDYSGKKEIEIVAFNGEDYFAVPGQMNYIAANQNTFSNIILNINIDGAGYKEGPSSFAFFDLPDGLHQKVIEVMRDYPGIIEGPQWPQGDHSIFVQYGRPAIAVSSKWFIEHIDSQDITHTPKDTIDIVDCNKLLELAGGISAFIRRLG